MIFHVRAGCERGNQSCQMKKFLEPGLPDPFPPGLFASYSVSFVRRTFYIIIFYRFSTSTPDRRQIYWRSAYESLVGKSTDFCYDKYKKRCHSTLFQNYYYIMNSDLYGYPGSFNLCKPSLQHKII